eukprot:6000142-Amphidinium_carterae.1
METKIFEQDMATDAMRSVCAMFSCFGWQGVSLSLQSCLLEWVSNGTSEQFLVGSAEDAAGRRPLKQRFALLLQLPRTS